MERLKDNLIILLCKMIGVAIPLWVFLSLITLISSCSTNEKVEVLKDNFCISDTMMKKIEIDTARLDEVENEIALSGKITFDEGKVLKVYPLAGGNIYEVKAELGDYVEKGEVLASIQSSDIATLEKDYEVAKSNLTIADKNMDVANELFKSGYGTEKEYITAQKEYHKAESELKRIKEVLNLFGKSSKTANYVIRAPISGFIVEKKINSDMQIRPDHNENIFTISDLKYVWVMANVYESDIPKVRIGYDAAVTTLSYPDKVFYGKIDKIFNVIDPLEKVMKVRVKLENPAYMLKPEMHAQVIVAYKEEDIRKIAIPTKSLIFDNNRNYVMIYNDKCDISTREVNIYKSGKIKTYITDGLNLGDKIISRSQLYIYDALND